MDYLRPRKHVVFRVCTINLQRRLMRACRHLLLSSVLLPASVLFLDISPSRNPIVPSNVRSIALGRTSSHRESFHRGPLATDCYRSDSTSSTQLQPPQRIVVRVRHDPYCFPGGGRINRLALPRPTESCLTENHYLAAYR